MSDGSKLKQVLQATGLVHLLAAYSKSVPTGKLQM